MSQKRQVRINLEKKFSEKQLDAFASGFYESYKKLGENAVYIFDLTEIEWISNQGLLVLTGLLKSLIEGDVEVKIEIIRSDKDQDIDRRKAKQLVEIWDIWKIYQIVPNSKDIKKYFGIDGNFIDVLKRKFVIGSGNLEIYQRYGVTPFISLEKLLIYDDGRIREKMTQVYKLGNAVNDVLKKFDCSLPFENKTISLIITKELYENFLDHSQNVNFGGERKFAFMSLSMKAKFDETKHASTQIQDWLEKNFEDEAIPESKNFFFDQATGVYRNRSLLQLSFLDFGDGIAATLSDQFRKVNEELHGVDFDSEVLRYAFKFDSSKDPIESRYGKSNFPRGLFDLLVIVKRFKGLILARSNHGKILYDFSTEESSEKAFKYFGNTKLFFPGTLITIYLPEYSTVRTFDYSSIKPNIDDIPYALQTKSSQYISLNEVLTKINGIRKDALYNTLFNNLVNVFSSTSPGSILYVDLQGFERDDRITRKLIYFLISNYHINLANSVIVLNPPPVEFMNDITLEIGELSEVVKSFIIHPTPFIYYDKEQSNIAIYWLGISAESDLQKLNDLLLDVHDLRKSDFENPEEIIGNVNYYDSHGNLKSLLDAKEIVEFLDGSGVVEFFSKKVQESSDNYVRSLLENCTIKAEGKVYLCSGNYYQHEYLQLYDILTNNKDAEFLSSLLFDKIESFVKEIGEYKFISISPSSQKIVDILVRLGKISQAAVIEIENFQTIFNEDDFRSYIKIGDKIVLVCEILSTGFVTKKLEAELIRNGASLECVAVLVNAIDTEFESDLIDYGSMQSKVVSVLDKPMEKFRREAIKKKLISKELLVIRVNPYTYAPITLSSLDTMYASSVMLTHEEFIEAVKDEHIKAGYFKFNNLIHPYFFDMDAILADEVLGIALLKKIVDKIGLAHFENVELVFYPRKSGINRIHPDLIKEKIFSTHGLEVIELDRYPTTEGWRFSHTASFLTARAKGKQVVILDDGSCSGESIIQMIDEVCFLGVESITIISIIGRVTDHKREFFSRLESVNGIDGKTKITVFFGAHWHIPTYYLEESPVVKERQWVEELVEFPNVPQQIKKVAENVLNEIRIRKINEGNNKLLLKTRDKSSIIKDLIVTKEAIGRITNFRFYKEYFHYFDDVILQYQQGSVKDRTRYQRIELICAVFLHEPYLYDRMRVVLPDLTEKIEEFVFTILFGNPNKPKNPILKKEDLYYDWRNKDILHLFFVVFKGQQLFDVLDTEKLVSIIETFGESSSDLCYILFKLSYYFSLHNGTVAKKRYSGKLKRLIEAVSSNLAKQKALKHYLSFIDTLPAQERDFDSAITRIGSLYSKITDKKYHEESISKQIDIINTQLEILRQNYHQDNAEMAEQAWEKISKFTSELLRFSSSYPEYLLPNGEEFYNHLENHPRSLRLLHGEISDLIYNITASTDFALIQTSIQTLYKEFIKSGSDYFKLFSNISTNNADKMLMDFFAQLEANKMRLTKKMSTNGSYTLALPKHLFENILQEIAKNLRYRDKKEAVEFTVQLATNGIELIIMNKFKNDSLIDTGGGNGLVNFKRLNDFPQGIVSFNHLSHHDTFKQTFYFATI